MLSTPSFATVYYGGAAGKDINANDLWYTAVTGSCAGDGSPVAWATVGAAGNTLVANGCTITIPNTGNLTITVDKITNLETDTPDSDCVDGGTFTYVTAADYALTLNADIETGATTHCLGISGSASGTKVAITGDITGGSGTAYGVNDSHTVGTVTVNGNITGGTNTAGRGYYFSGATGTVTVSGNCISNAVPGCQLGAGGTMTVNGDCTAAGAGEKAGCYASATGAITCTGSIIGNDTAVGVQGRIKWEPSSSKKYILMDGGGTPIYASAGLGSDSDGTQITAANTAAQVLTTGYFVNKDDSTHTQGTATTTGGGVWGY